MYWSKVDTVTQAKEKIEKHVDYDAIESEHISIMECIGRVVSETVYSPINLPEFNRSVVDGYAICSSDTFGVSESMPAFLHLVGEVEMGKKADGIIRPGEAIYVPTGAMIPSGADAVVMIEYVENLDELTLAVYKAVSPGEGMIKKGDDLKEGDTLLEKGRILKSKDIGALVGTGINSIRVFKKPRVTIISTGDELVDYMAEVKEGEVRDINTYSLAKLIEELGAQVDSCYVIKDNYEELKECVNKAKQTSEIIIISGGSSVGEKDVTAKVIDAVGSPGILTHGIAIKPGKPTIIGKCDKHYIVGLPGHPVSALIVCKIFVGHLINCLLNSKKSRDIVIEATSSVNIPGAPGRETYQMVQLEKSENQYIATPIHGKSGAISLMLKADGYITIPSYKEGIQKEEIVQVTLN